jgi:type IV pilus assembly protein PilB
MSIINTEIENKIKARITDLGIEDDEKIAHFLAERSNLPYIDLRIKSPDLDALHVISLTDAQKYNLAPFKLTGFDLHIAITDPSDEETIKYLKKIKDLHSQNKKNIIVYICSQTSMKKIHARYKDIENEEVVAKGLVTLDTDYFSVLLKDIKSINDFQKVVENVAQNEKKERISKIIELTMAGALHFNVSDIHTEPEQDKVRIRYRIDGNLNDIFFTDLPTYAMMNSRLKLLSGLKLSTTMNAQDGRFSIASKEGDIEMRVSLVPGAYGESFVMRILDPRNANVPFDSLGMSDAMLKELEKAIKKPFGMILTTGPTGSGKSTTLYSCLRKVYNKETKIITIEDPVEYHFEGITQTQVDVKKDYTFLSGLRAALRQDPDIIMVGEIRDNDTAKIASQAALTGHIVLSTLHTNSAAGAIPRFIDLGVDAKTLGSSLSFIMAQRLCRKLCSNCKIKQNSNEGESKIITNMLGVMISDGKEINYKPQNVYDIYAANANGCEQCMHGYKGRIGIFEGIKMNQKIETAAIQGGSERDIRAAAADQKLPNMQEDAILKILAGVTSFDEVEKVVDLYNL